MLCKFEELRRRRLLERLDESGGNATTHALCDSADTERRFTFTIWPRVERLFKLICRHGGQLVAGWWAVGLLVCGENCFVTADCMVGRGPAGLRGKLFCKAQTGGQRACWSVRKIVLERADWWAEVEKTYTLYLLDGFYDAHCTW